MIRSDDIGFGSYTLLQDTELFCYGTDAVLLASFAADAGLGRKYRADDELCDMCTGNGVIALMLAARTQVKHITGVEIQEASASLAAQSVAINGLDGRVSIVNADVREYAGLAENAGRFDAVTMNPPYTEDGRGVKSTIKASAAARHELNGSLDDLMRSASMMLKDKGELYMIHRPGRVADICVTGRKYKLEPKEMQFVSGMPMQAPNMVLVRCVKNGNKELKVLESISVRNEDGTFSNHLLKIKEDQR